MCDKVVDTYPSTINFVPECYKTKEMCHRAVHRGFFVFDVIPDNMSLSCFFIFSFHSIVSL